MNTNQRLIEALEKLSEAYLRLILDSLPERLQDLAYHSPVLVASRAAIEFALQEKEPAPEPVDELDSHGRYWVQNRGRIISALSDAGFELVSNKEGFTLHKVAR